MTQPSSPSDLEKRTQLRQMKAIATAFFVAATVLFVVARVLGDRYGWVGYLEAFSEAAMVGALADWFAVTALFRHPLGLPIPHTAIIPERKDQIGRSLGDFVQGEFLTPEVITERLRGLGVARRFGAWLTERPNAERASEALGDAVRAGLEILDDADVQRAVEQLVEQRLRSTPAAPLVGRSIELAVDGGHHQRILDSTLIAVGNFLDDNRDVLRDKLARESPWWVPEPLDERIFAKIYDGVHSFLGEVANNPTHELRRHLDARMLAFAERLKDDPELLAKGEQLKDDALAHPDVRAWLASLWGELRRALESASSDADSELRVRMVEGLQRFGARLTTDPALADKLERWLDGAVAYVVTRYRGEVGDLIATTVERWDAEDTSDKMELQVGRDLQFIRINGTLVGGLAGLAIYSLGRLFF
ncbi:MAG: DUF445 domain-containing protein [Ilumatobacteraceae bacterium]